MQKPDITTTTINDLNKQQSISDNSGISLEPTITLKPSKSGKPLVRWFVSYARDDTKLKTEFLKILNARLKNSKDFEHEIWDDGDLIIGDNWFEEIQQRLQHCHAGLLLLSHNFLASKFIEQNELPQFLKQTRHLSVPLVLEQLNFADTDLKGLEEQQIFRDSDNKAFNERINHKRKSWVDQLITKINKKLSILSPKT